MIGEFVKVFGNVLLYNYLGEVWQYGFSQDVFVVFVEVMFGQIYDEFLQECIFGLFGMIDIQYWVDESKYDWFVIFYVLVDVGIVCLQVLVQDFYKLKLVMFGGGLGFVFSVGDYLCFCQMLFGGGEIDGICLLSCKSVEFMVSDYIGDLFCVGGFIGL